MSGWGTADWAQALFTLAMVLAGLNLLLRPPEVDGRWWGIMPIVIGLITWFDPSPASREPWFMITMGGFALAMAFWSLAIHPPLYARRLERYQAELSARALGEEEYSESLRAFHADSPEPLGTRRRLTGGAFLILFGGTMLALGLAGAGR